VAVGGGGMFATPACLLFVPPTVRAVDVITKRTQVCREDATGAGEIKRPRENACHGTGVRVT